MESSEIATQLDSHQEGAVFPTSYDPMIMGPVNTPKLLDHLGEYGIGPTGVAVLRLIYRYAGSDWACCYQPELAKQLGIDRRTAQRAIRGLVDANLIQKRKSDRKPKDRGYLCEYKIDWPSVYSRLHLDPVPAKSEVPNQLLQYANHVSVLPFKFFNGAWFKDGRLILLTKDDKQYSLPGDDREVLRYIYGKHYGRAIPPESLDYYVRVAARVTPRLVSLLTAGFMLTKTQVRSPNYYTKLLEDKLAQAKKPPRKYAKKKAAPFATIKISEQGGPFTVVFRQGTAVKK